MNKLPFLRSKMSLKCKLCQRGFFRKKMKRMLVLTNYAKNWANTIYLRLKVLPFNWFLHVSFFHFAFNLSLQTKLKCFFGSNEGLNICLQNTILRSYDAHHTGPSCSKADFSANHGLNLNPGVFFFCSKAFPRIIFSILLSVSNHQIETKRI